MFILLFFVIFTGFYPSVLFFVIFTGFYPSLFLDIMSSYTYMFFEHILI